MENFRMEHAVKLSADTEKKKKNILFYFSIAVLVLTIIRIVLNLIVPIRLLTNQIHDDQLLFQYAEGILNFDWLGDYNNRTLVKGASYSLFIALCSWLHIPYTLGFGLFNIGSAYLLITALKRRFSNKIALYCIYLLLIYAPYTYSSAVGLRAYRMAIVPFAVLLVFGCLIGLYFRKAQSPKTLIPWSLGAGVSMGFFWFIREDSIWILPFVAVILLILGICVVKEKSRISIKIKKLILTVIPVFGLVIAILGVCFLNYHYYGVFTTNDRSSGEFGKMMGYLYSIEDENAPSDVWVSHDVLVEAMEVSPTLNSIQEEIETYYNSWGGGNAIKGDLIAWSLRDAVTMAGYYENAADTEAFYAQVNQELDQAFQNGKLQRDDTIRFSNSAEGIRIEQIPDMLYQSMKQMVKLSLFYDADVDMPYSVGAPGDIKNAEILTRTSALYPQTYNVTLNGSLTSKTGQPLSMNIFEENGALLQTVSLQLGSDNQYHFSCNFNQLAGNQLQIQILQNGELIDSFVAASRDTEQYTLQLEKVDQGVPDAKTEQVSEDISFLGKIQTVYSTLAPIVNVFAFIGYILEIVFLVMLKKQKKVVWPELERWLVVTGFALSAFVLTFGVEFFCSWIEEAWVINFYACGAYTLLMLVKYLSIYLGISAAWNWWKNRHTTNKTALVKQ